MSAEYYLKQKINFIDQCLVEIFVCFNRQFMNSQFELIDLLLKVWDVNKFPKEITACILMASYPAKDKLKYRDELLDQFMASVSLDDKRHFYLKNEPTCILCGAFGPIEDVEPCVIK